MPRSVRDVVVIGRSRAMLRVNPIWSKIGRLGPSGSPRHRRTTLMWQSTKQLQSRSGARCARSAQVRWLAAN